MPDNYYPTPGHDHVEGETKLYTGATIHLWLADLKNNIEFDSRKQEEGARKLVEAAGSQLGVHGLQLLQEEAERVANAQDN